LDADLDHVRQHRQRQLAPLRSAERASQPAFGAIADARHDDGPHRVSHDHSVLQSTQRVFSRLNIVVLLPASLRSLRHDNPSRKFLNFAWSERRDAGSSTTMPSNFAWSERRDAGSTTMVSSAWSERSDAGSGAPGERGGLWR